MKKILALLIALLFCISAFSGCKNQGNDECEHKWELISQSKCEYKCSKCGTIHLCGNPEDLERVGNLNESTAVYKCKICGSEQLTTDPNSVSDKRSLIVITIAETLPSCAAFEYKDETPYCFYGYGDDGSLYRVLWNDFVGLNEKDRVAVGYNDEIIALTYEEYPSGPTPQGEIIATGVFPINSTGIRIYDAYHPDDSERYPYFSVTLPVLNNAKVEYRNDSKIYVDEEYLLGGSGNGCNSFYLSDLTGDGVPELCFGMNLGSGFVDMRIEIIDYTTKERLFLLADRMSHDYYLFLRDGVLCVKETECMQQSAVRTGVLVYNGSNLSVVWDSKVNATVDRDNVPQPGRPIS